MSKQSSGRVTLLVGPQKKLFDEALDLFDRKQYELGLDCVRRIRAVQPNNGEALGLEGLLIHSMGQLEEGYALVKRGLGISMRLPKPKSAIAVPFCSRVYALMYKEDKQFVKSRNSFLNALRHGEANVTVWRDLAAVQAQLRDWPGHLKSRLKVIELQSSQARNWLWLSFALHMSKKHKHASNVIEKWLVFQDEEVRQAKNVVQTSEREIEKNRVLMYKLSILFEASMFEACLGDMRKYDGALRDRKAVDLLRGKCLVGLGRMDQAKRIFLGLLESNPDNHEFLRLYLQTSLRLSRGEGVGVGGQIDLDLLSEGVFNRRESEEVIALLDELAGRFVRSKSFRRIPLTALVVNGPGEGEEEEEGEGEGEGEGERQRLRFRERFEAFVVPYLRKTVPSMFDAVKRLCDNPAKAAIIEDVMQTFETRLSETGKLLADQEQRECPSTLVWVLLFSARLRDRLHRYEEALTYIERAIEHTPTLIQLYMTKGRILKHLNRVQEAKEAIEYSRKLDLADRFVNMKAVKYLLANDEIELARTIAHQFANDHEGVFNLHAMQCVRYEKRLADSYRRSGKISLALREYERVRQYFVGIDHTTFDFFDFYVKKCSLLPLIDAIKFAQTTRSNPMYLAATKRMVECYLVLDAAEGSELCALVDVTEVDFQTYGLLPEDSQTASKLTQDVDFLEAAFEKVRELEALSPRSVSTYELELEVFNRKKKPMALLRAVRKLQKLDSTHEAIAPSLQRVREMLAAQEDSTAAFSSVLRLELAKDGIEVVDESVEESS